MNDMTQSISIDPSALLTTSTINALHFPDLTTSGISESGGGKTIHLNLEGVGMCESMTESFCSIPGQDDLTLINTMNSHQNETNSMANSSTKLSKKDSLNAQKKRRSRKAQYDATTDGIALDRIESVNVLDEQIEPDDVWLIQIPSNGNKMHSGSENIFSWVHKEFKENDINATKHRLLCKLDDVSNARTIRSISCHNFPANQRSDSVKRSSTEQQVNSETLINGRTNSPLRTITPTFNGSNNTRPTSPNNSSPLRHTIAGTNTIRSRDVSKEREPLDYTDLEVMAKVQLENLRQAERQGPLSKRFGGSSNTLLGSDSRDVSPSSVFGATRNTSPVGNPGAMTPRRSFSPSPANLGRIPIRKNSFVVTESQYSHVLPSVSSRSSSPILKTDQTAPKPPVAPKSLVPRNGVKPNNHRRSNTQTISTNIPNGYDLPEVTDSKSTTIINRPNIAPTNQTINTRPRPPVTRPIQKQMLNNVKVQPVSTTPTPAVQRNGKRSTNDLGSTFTARQLSTENNLLNDVSNKPLTTGNRTQISAQRRTPTQSSVEQILSNQGPPATSTSMEITSSSIPRSSSSLSQGRKSGIPTIGKQQRPSIPTTTRITTPTNSIPSSQSSDNMMITRNIRSQAAITRPQIPDTTSPTSSWNEGCF